MTESLPLRHRLEGTPDPSHEWPGAPGVAIRGDSWGDPNGRPVYLLHGGGQTRHAWKGAGEVLGEAGYHAIAFDARGHGDSDWAPKGIYDNDDQVTDLECVIKAVGGAPPILVGASMGGGTSLLAVGERNLNAAAVVLVDMAPRIAPEGSAKIREFMSQAPDGFESLEQVADAIANYQPHRERPRNLDGLVKNVRQGDDGRYYWHWDPRRMQRAWNMDEYRDRLEEAAKNLTGTPTLLVRGGLSDVLTEEGAQKFLAVAPHAEYVSVSDAAHMVAGDRNDIFAGAVIEFLARRAPAAG
ncbi:MAG: pimeloyl-ACP methyl ester carboxylesterase [Candidatus Poriferisodalaceae bacterium]|jgi:pimeloyl-ACP methyl ester carboxylesterase